MKRILSFALVLGMALSLGRLRRTQVGETEQQQVRRLILRPCRPG